MKITSVSQYKGKTYCIEIADHDNVYISGDIAAKFNLKSGLELPEQALEEIIHSDLLRKAKERALHLISARDYCFVELYNKLSHTYPHDISLSTCKKIAELGFVNDDLYAEKYARQLFNVKKLGMFRAKQEMKRKGLTDDVIEAAIMPYLDKDDTMERLEELVEKKYERYLIDDKGVKKVKSALARLGYSYDCINAVLDLYDLDFNT